MVCQNIRTLWQTESSLGWAEGRKDRSAPSLYLWKVIISLGDKLPVASHVPLQLPIPGGRNQWRWVWPVLIGWSCCCCCLTRFLRLKEGGGSRGLECLCPKENSTAHFLWANEKNGELRWRAPQNVISPAPTFFKRFWLENFNEW